MKIKKIHIENFGRLKDFSIALNDGLNEFYFENGFGKTTLSIFLKAMLYGMPPARENIKMERKKYMPWQGGNFGGYVEFEHEDIAYRLTRFFAKTPEGDTVELLNLNTNKIVDLKGQEIGDMIFGVGRETFEMTAFFPQLNFSVLSNQQMTANILGLEKFKYDLANLNTAIATIKKKITEIKREKPKKEEIDFIGRSLKECQLEIAEQQNKLKDISQKIAEQNKDLALLEKTASTVRKEQEIKAQMQLAKQKLEGELRENQSELNNLLTQLNDITNKELSEKSKSKEKDKKRGILHFSLIMLGILGIIAGITTAVIKVSIIAVLCISIVSLILMTVGFVMLIVHKKSSGKQANRFGEEKNFLNSQIAIHNEKIELLQNSLNLYENIDDVSDEQTQYNDTLYKARLDFQTLEHERITIGQKLDNLIERNDILKGDFEKKNDLIHSIDKKIDLLTKAKDFLIQANENVSSRFVEPANRIIKEILTKFDMRNREFIVDTNFDIKEITTTGIKEQEYSSQGYQDILAFCVRVYFLKEIYKQDKPFIVLDDTFVNLDDVNLNNAREIIKDLERQYQIIYMCCHERCKMRG